MKSSVALIEEEGEDGANTLLAFTSWPQQLGLNLSTSISWP